MSSRQDILARIRLHQPPETPLPDLSGNWITYEDRERQFRDVLEAVGGQSRVLPAGASLEACLRELPCLEEARRVVCVVPALTLGTIDLDAVAQPHELEDVDVAILPGEFAVAENAAVWLSDRNLRHRAVCFLAQHVVLIVPREMIVHNLHEAYERLQFDGPGYGLFVSGPSKTADIEQSLVIGAHGPRSLTVVLTEGSQ